MGRVSKRGLSFKIAASKQKDLQKERKRYKAGIYARLSSDQNEKKNESVEVQIEIARNFVEEFNRRETGEVIEETDCYIDLGKTGSNFERVGFLRLLQDIRIGKINCVIVKDLSRFGRNYLEAGNYIEKIFPFLGVRFIAVADEFDTGEKGNESKQMASEIKNLVNDMYAKDFSKKAILHLKQRREEGSYVGGPPPYGYRAERDGRRRILIPDENTAAIVRFIYEKFVEKESYTIVADELSSRHINPPYLYQRTGNVYNSSEVHHAFGDTDYKGWDKSAVERIVKSETYIGTLVQGKTGITARNEENRIHNTEDDWVVTKEAHEPLVDRELYQKAADVCQKIQKKSASHKHTAKGCPIEENIFDSVLYCGVCSRKMTRISHVKQYANREKKRLDGYLCLNGGQIKVKVCPDSNRISKNELVDTLLPLICMEIAVFLNQHNSYIEYGNEKIVESIKKAETSLREIKGKIRRSYEEESIIYMDYHLGKISQKEYAVLKMKQEGRQNDLREQQERQQKEIKEREKLSEKYLAAITALLKLKSGIELTKDMLEAFIWKLYVYPGKRIEVIFAFTAGCLEGSAIK